MLRIRILTVALLLAPTFALGAPSSSLLGDWSEPTVRSFASSNAPPASACALSR